MIEVDRVRSLRDRRRLCVVLIALCVAAIITPSHWIADVLLTVGAVFFINSALIITVELREAQLDTNDLPIHERRKHR